MKNSFKVFAALFFFCGALSFGVTRGADASPSLSTHQEPDGIRVESPYLSVKFSSSHPAFLFLGADSLGGGKVRQDILPDRDASAVGAYTVTPQISSSQVIVRYAQSVSSDASAAWSFQMDEQKIHLISQWSETEKPEPLIITFDTKKCHSTLLGLFDKKGDITFPAILHLPGFGTFSLSVEGDPEATLGYSSGKGWIKVTFPPATQAHPKMEYSWDITTIYPRVAGIENDARFDGFRRNWLNIFQLHPGRRLLANNTYSDTCGFCYYEYADIAAQTPPLADHLYALDMIRQSLDLILAGTKTYGMPGYEKGAYHEVAGDTYPALLIAARDYVDGKQDKTWLQDNYAGIKDWADKMLATDDNGNGLIKYGVTGNSGSWPEGDPKFRPSNWWDTIGFGHEDAYANALAYRALQGMQHMAAELNHTEDAAHYEAAAKKLHDAYFSTFFNAPNGILAGWRSADGELHDYDFLFVNSIAVLYGLVPKDKEADIMNQLWDKMKQVGYTKFELGLPGNLVPVARKDYAHKNPRYGGGVREDNSDGFQIYENGGATACFSYFTITAFNHVGQGDRADQILFPILNAFEKREFEGSGANKLTNDWRKWDGTSEGYEGFLTDNYYTLLAVPERKK